MHILIMSSREIIIVDSSDDDESEEEQEFDWVPTRNRRSEDDEQVDALDFADALPSFCCPICHCIMRDPVVLSDGHSYE